MRKLTFSTFPLIVAAGLVSTLSSCAFIDTTTETVANTSDATTEFTSSTSPRSDSGSSNSEQVSRFIHQNFDSIREDMALGGGEHLASLASLLDISKAQQSSFFKLTKEKFPILFGSDSTTPEDLLAKLNEELMTHPELRS